MAVRYLYRTTITASYTGIAEAEITITAESKEEAEKLLRNACSRYDTGALEDMDEHFSAEDLNVERWDPDCDDMYFEEIEELGPTEDTEPSELPVRYRDAPGQMMLFPEMSA